MKKIHLLILGMGFLVACSKSKTESMSNIPAITFESVSPSNVSQFKDSLVFTFGYKDGDGDLGENNAGAYNLFLTDNRVNIAYKYRISQLAPDNAKVPIQGKLSLTLKSTEITDNSSDQSATFSIYVTDRAGNKSNTVTSSAITISK